MTRTLLNLILVCTFFITSTKTSANLIDLNTWNQTGLLSNGNWNVSADGTSVTQTKNGKPTFFVSPNSYINSEFTGTVSTQTAKDNDFLGFVFGYNGLDDFYLFDWKQKKQAINGKVANEGFTLSKISAGADVTTVNGLWDHMGTGISILDTDYGNGRGWANHVVYDITLGYSSTEINISINGGAFNNEQIFSLANLNNSAGQFGFYNSSQKFVNYSNFEENSCNMHCSAGDIPEPSILALFSLAILALTSRTLKR